MPQKQKKLSPIERFLTMFTRIRPGEGSAILVYSAYAMALMTSYYLLKVLRDALILSEHSAEVKSYVQATIAIVLLFVIPFYGFLYRRTQPINLVRWITLFFAANLLLFLLAYGAELRIGFVFFVWVSIFSLRSASAVAFANAVCAIIKRARVPKMTKPTMPKNTPVMSVP